MAISLKNKNFAVSKLLSGIASDATQLTVLAGEGSKFPTSGQFRAVIWSQSYESPIQDGTREIVTMQLSSGDTFNITRAQESTAAKAWNANDNVAHVISAGKIDELETEINAKKTDNVSATSKVLGRVSAGAGAIEEIPLPLAVNLGGHGVSIQPKFRAHKNSVDQSFPKTTWTKITFPTEDFDTNNNFSDSKFTPTVAGTYLLAGRIYLDLLAAGKQLYIAVYKNGSFHLSGPVIPAGADAPDVANVVVGPVSANGSTDYFEIYAYHNDTVDRTIRSAPGLTYFQGNWIGP
jgi:hypothetical protein